MKTRTFLTILLIFAVALSYSQEITGLQVIQNMKYKFKEIQDYTVDIEANLQMDNLRMPRIKMKMYFKNPDKFHYESKGFALLPKGGINFNPLIYDEEKFDFAFKGKETLEGREIFIVDVQKKQPQKTDKEQGKKEQSKKKQMLDTEPQKSTLWVDAQYWVAKKISTGPDEKRLFSMAFSHELINNFYMPVKINVEYDVPVNPEDKQDKEEKVHQRRQRMGSGKGSVLVILKNYVINSGLSDDIFKEENKKK